MSSYYYHAGPKGGSWRVVTPPRGKTTADHLESLRRLGEVWCWAEKGIQ